jgi:hypothetical protein
VLTWIALPWAVVPSWIVPPIFFKSGQRAPRSSGRGQRNSIPCLIGSSPGMVGWDNPVRVYVPLCKFNQVQVAVGWRLSIPSSSNPSPPPPRRDRGDGGR